MPNKAEITDDEFLKFYPQFKGFPKEVREEYIKDANLRFEEYLESMSEARRLYVAHKLTLYGQNCGLVDGDNVSMDEVGSAGMAAQVFSKSVGGVSVSRSEGSAISGIRGFAEWKETAFGVQLITLCKRAAAGGKYVK